MFGTEIYKNTNENTGKNVGKNTPSNLGLPFIINEMSDERSRRRRELADRSSLIWRGKKRGLEKKGELELKVTGGLTKF